MERWLVQRRIAALCLKTLFHFKNRQVFLAHPIQIKKADSMRYIL